MPERSDRPSERGAALLTVLLLVAVIAVLAGTALEKLRLATRLGGNAVALDQARAYAIAAEVLAVGKVSDLLSRNPERVTLAGGWSDTPFALPIPNGVATERVVDGGNCFNLNSLVAPGVDGANGASLQGRLQFVRLIRLVAPEARSPDAIAGAAIDWIDSDSVQTEQGAEDSAYNGGPASYRTPNTLMTDPSELRAVAGVTRPIYDKLRPWLCTLPEAKPSPINVNTLLPEQAPLIAMLLPDTLSIEGARQILLKRPPQGFSSKDQFWAIPALAGIVAPEDAKGQTSITTKWFTLKVDVSLGGTTLQQSGLIDASTLPARLVSRQWGEPS